MNKLLQVGEWGRELAAEEWEQIERDVDMGYLSYDDARRKLGVEPPVDQNAPSNSQLSSGQSVPADEKPRPRRRCYFTAFDTRTGDAMLAYASEQEPSDDKWRN